MATTVVPSWGGQKGVASQFLWEVLFYFIVSIYLMLIYLLFSRGVLPVKCMRHSGLSCCFCDIFPNLFNSLLCSDWFSHSSEAV